MAEEVEMIPVAGDEPPKADPLAKPAAPKAPTVELRPPVRKPVIGGTTTAALKPGLKLPPKPTAGAGALKPGLKLPPKPAAGTGALKPGLKLPPKPAAGAGALKPGLKLPTQPALKPGVRLPAKPVIRKPGATVTASPLPKPVVPTAATPAAPAPAAAASAPAAAAPTPAAPAAPAPAAKPVSVDAQGVSKLPTVEAQAIARTDTKPTPPAEDAKSSMAALRSVTQKLKGLTQEIPQQAILRKTGIIADAAMTDAQKEAAKHKTARISLSDAMGVAPVKNENAPMKTIRIKRPVGIPGATSPLKPQPPSPSAVEGAEAKKPEEEPAAEPAPSVTQRKTLKIARPGGGAVRPSGRFGIKRPSHDPTALKKPSAAGGKEDAPAPADGAVADIPDIPDLPMAPMAPVAEASNGPAWLWTLSALVQLAACVAMGALAWFLYENTQTAYF